VEELIVDRDAEIDARNDEGKTALWWARKKVMTTLFHIWTILVKFLVRKMWVMTSIVPSAKNLTIKTLSR